MSQRYAAMCVFVACVLAGLALSGPAVAQELLFHFPLDGSAAVQGSAAGDARLYVLDDGPPPATVPGKFGNALYFSGNAAIAMPFALDHAVYPQVTVTAWVKVDAQSTGERTVFSAGNGNVPKLSVYGDRANFVSARAAQMFDAAMPRDEWVFVAGVIDVTGARIATHQGDGHRVQDNINIGNLYGPSGYRNPEDPSVPFGPYVFIGSHGFGQWRADKMAIDDVRVYTSALTAEQVAAIRDTGAASQAVATSGNTGACQSSVDCAAGTYCAVDGACYPDSQLPVGYVQPSGTPSFYQVEGLELDPEDRPAGPLDLAYASEEEALAAAEARERQAAQDELARQQNELEAQRVAESGSPIEEETTTDLRPVPVGEPRFSGVAGHVGQNKRTLDLQDQFLHRIAWFESSDSPCRIAIAGLDVASEAQLDVGCPRNIRPFGLFLSDQARSVELTDSVIGSIAVCNNNPRALYNEALRLKGIRVSGARIADDGTTTYVPASDEDSLRNCAEWSIPNLCPVNPTHLATGLIVHSNDSGSTGDNEDIVGLQLICRQVGLR
jgi:hypothetical protein